MRVFLIKQYFLIVFLLLSGVAAEAQVLGRFYYNKYWELTRPDSAAFFRVCVFDTTRRSFAGPVQDFTKAGQLLMKGGYKNGDKSGEFTFYYPSGQIESQGSYSKNERTGLWKYFYANGLPKQQVEFGPAFPKIIFYNDSTGSRVLENGDGKWIEERLQLVGHKYNRIVIQGQYKDGNKTGKWTYARNGEPFYRAEYKNGHQEFGFLIPHKGKKEIKTYGSLAISDLPPPSHFAILERLIMAKNISVTDYPFLRTTEDVDNGIRVFANTQAEFPGGMEALQEFVMRNLHYPETPWEGRVFVSFIIEKDGAVSSAQIAKGITPVLDAEAVRIVNSFPNWLPAMTRGKPVRLKFILPISFRK